MTKATIRTASWEIDKTALMQIRRRVFVDEQNVPQSLEADDFDSVSMYVLAEATDGTPVGCARLQPNGKVTRIAVHKDWRRRGLARQMLTKIIDIADTNNIEPLYLHAQLGAISLYEEFGFLQQGDQFEEAGIKHIKMIRSV